MSTKSFTIIESEGKIYKVSKGKDGEEIKREVQQCGCGEFISKKTVPAHLKSKKHHDWEIRQFRPWFVLTRYRDLLVQMQKLEEEILEVTSEIHWEQEDQEIIDLEEDEDKKGKFNCLKAVFMKEDIDLPMLEDVLLKMKEKKPVVKKIQKAKKSSKKEEATVEEEPLVEEESVSSVEVPVSVAKTSQTETKHPPTEVGSDQRIMVEQPSQTQNDPEEDTTKVVNKTIMVEQPSQTQNDPEEDTTKGSDDPMKKEEEYIIAPNPDPDLAQIGSYMIVSLVTNTELPDMKTFFKRYNINIDKYCQDIRDEGRKSRFCKAVNDWDMLRGSNFEDGWDPEDNEYFEREKFIRQFPLVQHVATVRGMTDETAEERLNRMMKDDRERRYVEETRARNMYLFYNREKNELYETEMIFPMIMKKSLYKHGRCQVCSKWVGGAVKYPCKHSICNECHHKKKRGSNCVPQCVVCGIRYQDEWVIILKPGETHDEEGNILKNGKIIKRYWEVQGV